MDIDLHAHLGQRVLGLDAMPLGRLAEHGGAYFAEPRLARHRRRVPIAASDVVAAGPDALYLELMPSDYRARRR